jgi:hypothetical protein
MEPERLSFRMLLEAIIEKRRHQRLLNNCSLLCTLVKLCEAFLHKPSSSQVIISARKQLMETHFDMQLPAGVRKRRESYHSIVYIVSSLPFCSSRCREVATSVVEVVDVERKVNAQIIA